MVIGVQGSQLGRGEPIRDTARVLERYCDAIVYPHVARRRRLTEMAQAAKQVPVINALSDDGHPVQVSCDVFTVEEALARRGDASGIAEKVAFVGDCSSNMARSWLEAARLFGFDLVLAGPTDYMPSDAELLRAGSRATKVHDPRARSRARGS